MSKPGGPMTALSVVSTLASSSLPSTTIATAANAAPVFNPTLRGFLSLIKHHLQKLFIPENSWLVTLLTALYILKQLRTFASRRHSSPTLPLPIDHSVFPQYIVNKAGLWLYTHHWPSLSYPPRAYIFLSPGYRDHSLRWESIARALSALGYSVWSLDHQGHGQSQGDRGFVWSFDDYVEDYLLFVEHVRANLEVRPCFLMGRGMGATIATLVMRAYADIEDERRQTMESRTTSMAASPEPLHRLIKSTSQPTALVPSSSASSSSATSWPAASLSSVASPRPHTPNSPPKAVSVDDSDARAASWQWHGCVLLSPAIIPPPSLSPLSEMFAHLFCDLLPHMHFFSVLDDDKLSRLPSVVRQWQTDPLVFKEGMRARWAVEFLQTMNELKEDAHVSTTDAQHTTQNTQHIVALDCNLVRTCSLADVRVVRAAALLRVSDQAITFPLLLCQGSEDAFVSPSGAEWVYKRSQSTDKRIKRYRGGYHDLLNDSIREQVFDDVVRWVDERVDR